MSNKLNEIHKIQSIETKAVNKANKRKASVRLMSQEDKQDLKSFLFGKSNYNPLNPKSKKSKENTDNIITEQIQDDIIID